MPAVELSVLLLMVFAPFQPIQGDDLRPPRNLTFVSKDYSLFMKWLPPDGSPPGMSYTVLWMESFDLQWEEVQHCRNITETICNITCAFQEPSNRYWFKVEARSRTWAGFVSSAPETIDYILQVQLAPPVLKVKYSRNILDVNVSFTYPSCMKEVFQDLTYDLEIWRVGFQKLVTLENTHEPSVEVNTTEWPYEEHCLRARTSFFRNGDRKRSNFSEPLCLLLHKEAPENYLLHGCIFFLITVWLLNIYLGFGVQLLLAFASGLEQARKWKIIALPLLAILVFGGVMLYFCYKKMIKQAEMSSVLDFSKYQHPKNLLEFDERNLTVNVLFILEQKNTPAQKNTHSLLSAHSLFKEDEDSEEEEEEGSSSLIPYTETLRFQKKDENCSTVEMLPKCSDSSSGSGNSQLSREGWLPAVMSEPFFTAEWMTTDASSGLLEKTFLSEESVMDESISFAGDFSAASGESEEVTNRDIDFLNKLMFLEGHGFDFSTDLKIRMAGVQGGSISASLQNSQTSLCSETEGQVTEEKGCEKDLSNCEDLQLEEPLLDMSCKDRVENGEGVENNTVKSTCHNYQPRQRHYISRN